MRILVSAFECNPYRGSDSYVGWSFSMNMAKLNDVIVLTREDNRKDIDKYFDNNPELSNNRIRFVYVNQSELFTKYLFKLNRYLGFLGSYFVWQKAAYKKAKKICNDEHIDLCHHISIADFRCAGYLWKCNAPFIFGPVGGAQITPSALKEYTKGHAKGELFREMMNHITTAMPGYRAAINRASLVYCSNDETKEFISKRVKKNNLHKVKQLTELCVDEDYLCNRENLCKSNSEKVHIIVSGRLIYRKGIALLIDSLPFIKTDNNYVLDVFGDGNQMNILKQKVRDYNLENVVVFHGKVGFDEMQEHYRTGDIFVLPSLRETTGTAVFEAMANKLPVITLNQNGAKSIVEDDAGILIPIVNKEQIVKDLGNALTVLIESPDLRRKLGESGFRKIQNKYTWNARVKMFDEIYKSLVCQEE